ncbi:MAG: protein kinase [Paracoccaceae bacterium]
MESRPTDLFQPGDLVNNTYRIEELLGRGGTSDVYKARSEISGRLVALKVLKAEFSGNDDYLVLLTREEEIREIRHDAVVRYSENHRTAEGHVYLLMDYVDGPGLDRRLKQGPMAADDLLTVCRRVAEGLNAAHTRNIVHRDLSPDNIILRDGDPAQAVIIDFGIAKDTKPGAETIVGNEFAGKYAYAAPEQLNGQTDPRTDLYSLGALLLANFRGESPNPGKNPMEVVQNKTRPLDTDGVPEPLKTLIDRATHPEPDNRFQSAADLLAYLDNPQPAVPGAEDDSDATVFVPRGKSEETAPAPAKETPKPSPKPKSTAAKTPEKSGGRGGLIAVLLVVLLAAAGGGGYVAGVFDGLLGPSYPLAEPYTLLAQKKKDGRPQLIGNAPSEDASLAITKLIATAGGTTDLTLASGDIPRTWSDDVLEVLRRLEPLEEWRVSVSGTRVQISGSTSDPDVHDQVVASFAPGLPGAMEGAAPEIELKDLFLAASVVQPELDKLSDCGPLEQLGVPVTGYGPDSAITVQGRVAEMATRIKLFDALNAMVEGRRVVLDVEVMNPTLCLIETHLPNAPAGGVTVEYRDGDQDTPNPSGRFFVGENPVIDVLLPSDMTDGYISVSILDVSGNVFHLLPNLNREDNSVAALRDGQGGPVPVRVAFPASQAPEGKLAFRVDDSTLGKSKVIILHSAEPLFEGLRPTAESAEGYAQALQDHAEGNTGSIQSLDSRILETSIP